MEQKTTQQIVEALRLNLITIVVPEHEVEGHSYRGYRLVDIIYSDYVEHGTETTSDNENGYNQQYGSRTHTVSKPLVVRKAMFVMVQSGDEALERKMDELVSLRAHVSKVEEAQQEAVKKADAQAKHVARLVDDKKLIDETLKTRTEELRAAQTSNRKLEQDIGKVREAVGALRMKEILESGTTR